MTYTYYADVRCLDNETLFREKVKLLSPYRQQKIAILRHEKDKNRSLAAGLLLDHALAAFGLQERSVEYEIGEWGETRTEVSSRDLFFTLPFRRLRHMYDRG